MVSRATAGDRLIPGSGSQRDRMNNEHILSAALGVPSAESCREDIRNPEPIRDKRVVKGPSLLRPILAKFPAEIQTSLRKNWYS